jgi:hypothetical protein
MKYLFIAAAATAILIQSSSAQTVDQATTAQAAMEQAVKAMGVRPSSAVTDKADAAMTAPESLPNKSDSNAAAAMSGYAK